MNKQDALNWALTYLQNVLGEDIEENKDFQEALKVSEEVTS